MTAVLSRYDGSTAVAIPDFKRKRSRAGRGAYLVFEGNAKPTGFRTTTISDTWDCTCTFPSHLQVDAMLLLDMLDDAFEAADGRLILEPGGRMGDRLPTVTGEVHEWEDSIQPVSALWTVSFTFIEVMG